MPTIFWGAPTLRPAAMAAAVFAGFLVLPAPSPRAQDITPEIENFSDTLDVPFVPSDHKVLQAMFEFTKPTKDDFLIDLGSGDGRIVITAAKEFGLRGYGVDLNKGLVRVANARAARAGVADRAKFYVRNLFEEDISRASIVTMYLLPEVVLQLRPKLFAELKPGSRIASHDYHLGNWRPDAARVVDVDSRGDESIVYYWMVPAKVGGTWSWNLEYPGQFYEPVSYQAVIDQHFQDIEGRVEANILPMRIHDATLSGTRIAFSVTGEIEDRIVRHDFLGVVDGDVITGSVRISGGVRDMTVPWSARRTKATN